MDEREPVYATNEGEINPLGGLQANGMREETRIHLITT